MDAVAREAVGQVALLATTLGRVAGQGNGVGPAVVEILAVPVPAGGQGHTPVGRTPTGEGLRPDVDAVRPGRHGRLVDAHHVPRTPSRTRRRPAFRLDGRARVPLEGVVSGRPALQEVGLAVLAT